MELSLMVLAGLTPSEWDTSIVDENLGVPDYPAMPRPDLVGITVFTSQANRAYEIAGHVRCLGVPVVMGGIHATMCLDEVLERVNAASKTHRFYLAVRTDVVDRARTAALTAMGGNPGALGTHAYFKVKGVDDGVGK